MDRLLHHGHPRTIKPLSTIMSQIIFPCLGLPAAVFLGIIFGPISDFVVKRFAFLKIYTFASSSKSLHVKFVRINASCAITVNKYSVLINGNFTSCNRSRTGHYNENSLPSCLLFTSKMNGSFFWIVFHPFDHSIIDILFIQNT